MRLVYRSAVAVAGSALALGGLVLVPLPGPGWLVVFAGLAVLGTEFGWARRLLEVLRARLTAWMRRFAQVPVVGRLLAVGGAALLAGTAAVGYLGTAGVPGWLPPAVQGWLASWVPTIG